MKKIALIFTVLFVLIFTPTGAWAKDRHKKHHKHHDDRSCHDNDRRYRHYDNYRSSYYAPRYYSRYPSYGYSRDCDSRYSYRRGSGIWISFN